MERVYLSFFLLHIVSTSSLILPNDQTKTGISPSKSKRLTLRSYDPLTRRSGVEKHFIRFGRRNNLLNRNERILRFSDSVQYIDEGSKHKNNIKKWEAFDFTNENVDREFLSSLAESNENFVKGRTSPPKVDQNVIFLVPEPESEKSVNRVNRLPSSFPQNLTDHLIRYGRRYGLGENNFIRYGRSVLGMNMFSRYDRGRDNFMRLGRSTGHRDETEKITYDGFMRLGRPKPTVYDRLPRKYDNFMRLGRTTDIKDHIQDEFPKMDGYGRQLFDRFLKNDAYILNVGDLTTDSAHRRIPLRHNSFIRLSRATEPFARFSRKYGNFMRLGRSGDGGHERFPRKHDSFMRLGRTGHDQRRLPSNNAAGNDHIYDTFFRQEDRYVRPERRPEEQDVFNWIDETGKRSMAAADLDDRKCIFNEYEGKISYLAQPGQTSVEDDDHDLTRVSRGHGNFIRLGRSVDLCRRFGLNLTPKTLNDLLDNGDTYMNQSDSSYMTKVIECLQNNEENTLNETSTDNEPASFSQSTNDDKSSRYLPNDMFTREARRRRLLLRFGRSNKENTKDFKRQPDSYQSSDFDDDDDDERYNSKNLPDFITEKTNKI